MAAISKLQIPMEMAKPPADTYCDYRSRARCNDSCIEIVADMECRSCCDSYQPDASNSDGVCDSIGCCTAGIAATNDGCSGLDGYCQMSKSLEELGHCDGKQADLNDSKRMTCDEPCDAVCDRDSDDCCATYKSQCCKPQENTSCDARKSEEGTEDDGGCCSSDERKCEEKDQIDQGRAEGQRASLMKTTNTRCTPEDDVGSCCEKKGCCNDAVSLKSTPSHINEHRNDHKLCIGHCQKAFAEYAAFIEKGKCICRGVLKKYRPSGCCTPVDKQHHPQQRCAPHDTRCCASSTTVSHPGRKALSDSESAAIRMQKERCCEKNIKPEVVSGRFSEENGFIPYVEKPETERPMGADIEHDAAREHVVLSVAGMTCSGCGRKVENVLKRIEGVTSFKVTFVSGTAEFDVDLSMTTVERVKSQLIKETSFRCTAVMSDGQAIDILLDDASADDIRDFPRNGFESIERTGKGTYRINYDPTSIGARTLLSEIPRARLAPPSNDSSVADSKKRLTQTAWATSLAAALTIPIVVLAWSHTNIKDPSRLIVMLVLATIVQCIAIPEFYIGAIKALVFSKVIETDMLVVLSITAAYGYSVIASGLALAGHTLEVGAFFETGALLITLVLLGRLMTAIARLKATSAVSVRSLQPERAIILHQSGEAEEIDARLLQFGDVFLVRPHCQIVTDGQVVEGQSSVDESMITGEGTPVVKSINDVVVAGTINGKGTLTVRLRRLPGKNSITDIAGLVDNALGSKPRVQQLADQFATWFIPIVLCIASVVFVAWLIIGLKLRRQNGGGAFGTAITYSIAVLAITCPCAVGLVVPMVLMIAGGVAAKRGIIIKQASITERAHLVTDVILDKTGTLTDGKMQVCHQRVYQDQKVSRDEIMLLAKWLTNDEEHPVSRAVNKTIRCSTSEKTELRNVQSIPGAGIECTWRGITAKAGSPYYLGIDNHVEVERLMDRGMTLLCLTLDSRLLAVWGMRSNPRPEAKQVIDNLSKRNIKCHIVSGDMVSVVEEVAREVRIPFENVAARQSPADKQRYVEKLMQEGRKVLFCGDGTNDAVAIAQADVGVQIGRASDVTRAIADVVLLGGLEGIPALLNLSKHAYRRIQFNFAWSAVYNILAILLAAGAFVKIRIPPAYAGLGEIVSVAPVIVVAMSLSWVKL